MFVIISVLRDVCAIAQAGFDANSKPHNEVGVKILNAMRGESTGDQPVYKYETEFDSGTLCLEWITKWRFKPIL